MSTSQVAFYTNRVGKFEKMRRNRQTNRQTKPGSDKTNAHLWHIYSHTPTHKLITAHLRCTVIILGKDHGSNGQNKPAIRGRHSNGSMERKGFDDVVTVVTIHYLRVRGTNK